MNKPQIYQKANGVQRRDASEVIESYFDKIRWCPEGRDRILDIGCGSGDVTFDLIRPRLPTYYEKLVGSDVSETMINHANKTYYDPRVYFTTLDISKKISNDLVGKFNHVLSFYCLHWVQEQRQAMENIYNLLTSHGDVLMCFLTKNPIYDVYKNMSKLPRWEPYMRDVQRFISPYHDEENPEKIITDLLEDIGFEVDICKCQEKTYIYPNLDILQKSVKAVVPFLDRIPKDIQEDFLTDYVSEIRRMKFVEENNNEKGEKIIAPYSLAVVYARKTE